MVYDKLAVIMKDYHYSRILDVRAKLNEFKEAKKVKVKEKMILNTC